MLVRKSELWVSRKLSLPHSSLKIALTFNSLFVSGFGIGPTIWGPFSELFGRMIPLFTGFFIFAIFQIPVAVAQNIETILICRFFQGLAGCAPLAIVGGALADIWNPVDRGVSISIFAAATFIGPVAGLLLLIH
jgi:DHA1 family multidrug resistance protein-like MFS transporter